MANLNTPVKELPGIGKTLAGALDKLKIKTVSDLLFYFPFRYLDFSKFTEIKDAKIGQTVTLRGVIKTIASRYSFRGRMSLAEAIFSDKTGSLKIVWFNQAYVAKYLKAGDEVLLSGKIEDYKGLQMSNPVYEKFSEETTHTGRIVPVYRITENLYNKTLRTLIKKYLFLANTIPEILPKFIIKNYRLAALPEAIAELHFPTSYEKLAVAKQRVIFDELFIQQLAVLRHKLLLKLLPAPKISPNIGLIKKFLGTLPFELTVGQKKALWQIVKDMEIKHPMNRLLQGDVGSGKTLVALVAALLAIEQNFQVALIAPTEILAKQHLETFYQHLKHYHTRLYDSEIKIGLLTNNFQLLDDNVLKKAELIKKIKTGKVNLVIGTHALLQNNLTFSNLGLVIIDEQHRFGVAQRAVLARGSMRHPSESAKANQRQSAIVPHLLSMSATPIPRTLALSFYSDLDVSTLTELPLGRQKVITEVVEETKREQAYASIKKQLALGRQAFIVTPRVEESEQLNLKSVKKEFERLSKEVFQEFKLDLLYGKMKGTDKDKAMEKFNARATQILVTTSVIEIGIDIPNATVMLIEGADRFGLAQLHQLRGRVGRGQHQSYCFLFTQHLQNAGAGFTDSSEKTTLERLEFFSKNHDGFKLAELDLEQRGFGNLFGTEQTGFNFKFSQFLTLKVLALTKQAATELISLDPELKNSPELKQKSAPFLEQMHLE